MPFALLAIVLVGLSACVAQTDRPTAALQGAAPMPADAADPTPGPGGAMIDPSTLPAEGLSAEASLDAALRAGADRVLRGEVTGADPVALVVAHARQTAPGAIAALALDDAALAARAAAALHQGIAG